MRMVARSGYLPYLLETEVLVVSAQSLVGAETVQTDD